MQQQIEPHFVDFVLYSFLLYHMWYFARENIRKSNKTKIFMFMPTRAKVRERYVQFAKTFANTQKEAKNIWNLYILDQSTKFGIDLDMSLRSSLWIDPCKQFPDCKNENSGNKFCKDIASSCTQIAIDKWPNWWKGRVRFQYITNWEHLCFRKQKFNFFPH